MNPRQLGEREGEGGVSLIPDISGHLICLDVSMFLQGFVAHTFISTHPSLTYPAPLHHNAK